MDAPSEKMGAYRDLYRYKEPFIVICDAPFVLYVKVTLGKSLVDSLQSLLGGEVKIVTTLCLLNTVRKLGTSMDPVGIRPSHCDHFGKITAYFACNPVACMKNFIKKFPGRRIVVCTMDQTTYYKQDPARIVVTTDGNRGIMVDSIARSPVSAEFSLMDEYQQIMRVRPPFTVVCQPAFVGFIEGLELNLTDHLQDFLGEKIKLVYTRCLRDQMANSNFDISGFREDVEPCSHSLINGDDCFRSFVWSFPPKGLVICCRDDIAYFKQVPGTILVKPNDNNDGIMLAASIRENLVAATDLSLHDHSDEFMQTDVQMVDAPSSNPQTPATPQASGTEAVFMDSLSYSIEECDINDRSYEKNLARGQGLSVVVTGFGENDFDSLEATLQELFGGCGEISRLLIDKDFDTGLPKGIAMIDFADNKGFIKALQLSGREVGGGRIYVTEAKSRGGTENLGSNAFGSEKVEGLLGGDRKGKGAMSFEGLL